MAARFHPIVPGMAFEGDWYDGIVPANISVGENCRADSAFCFKHYFAKSAAGLRLGDHVTLWRASLSVEEGGEMSIGDYCYVSYASLLCTHSIRIGARVHIAGGVTIADADFHPLGPATRLADTVAISPQGTGRRPAMEAQPVVIEDDVWIGYNATILKGVHVGHGAVVEPGALVLADVRAGVRVRGNPAREIG